jgi:membrane protein
MNTLFESELLGRIWRIIRTTIEGIEEHESPVRAAALAYHGILSLFPLLLFLVFVGSQFLTSFEFQESLDTFLEEALVPSTVIEVKKIVDTSVQNRGSIGLLSIGGLIWTSSNLFNNLTVSLNVIWGASLKGAWRRRVGALLAVLGLGTLFLASVILSTISALPFLDQTNPLWGFLDIGVGMGITLLLFWVLYWALPQTKVRGRAAFSGALIATIAWEGAQQLFRWFLTSGLDNFDAVYGSLASIVALIVWAYLTGMIIFVGAEVGATLQREFWPVNGGIDLRAEQEAEQDL